MHSEDEQQLQFTFPGDLQGSLLEVFNLWRLDFSFVIFASQLWHLCGRIWNWTEEGKKVFETSLDIVYFIYVFRMCLYLVFMFWGNIYAFYKLS